MQSKSASSFTPKQTDTEQLYHEEHARLQGLLAKLHAREHSRDNYRKLYLEEWAACDRLRRVVFETEQQVNQLREQVEREETVEL